MKLVEKGNQIIDDSLDLKALLETQRMVRILGTILLDSKQKVLASMGKEYYLDPEATEEDDEKDFICEV